MTVRWTVRSAGDQGAEFAPRIEPRPENVAKQHLLISSDEGADIGALTFGSPTARKYSCYASLDTLTSSTPCLARARRQKQHSVVFASLTRNPLQKKRSTLVVLLFFSCLLYGAVRIAHLAPANCAAICKDGRSRLSTVIPLRKQAVIGYRSSHLRFSDGSEI